MNQHKVDPYLGIHQRNVPKYTYTETDFHACMLVHGGPKQLYLDAAGYWPTIDEWFKAMWPDRWTTPAQLQAMASSPGKGMLREGQMEFKLQFYDWSRDMYHKQEQEHPLYGTNDPRFIAQHKLMQLQVKGRFNNRPK